jgi:hypothetical protein
MVEQRPFKALVVGSSPTQPTIPKPLKTSGLHKKKPANRGPVWVGNNCRFLPKNTAFCVFTGTLLALDLIRFAPILCGLRAVHPFLKGDKAPNSSKNPPGASQKRHILPFLGGLLCRAADR